MTSGAAKVAGGWLHGCYLSSGGAVLCAGNNGVSQLGDGTTAARSTHVPVLSIGGPASGVAAGQEASCALAGGAVWCWGNGPVNGDPSGQRRPIAFVVGNTTGATALALRYSHACALIADGTVRCWGLNYQGQLGDGTTVQRTTAVPVPGVSGAVAVGVGNVVSCAIVGAGAVKCWGTGPLGNDTFGTSYTPVDVLDVADATALVGGEQHMCALVAGGAVKCWGQNTSGALGTGDLLIARKPASVRDVTGATAIAAGRYHTCALVGGGAVKCWGYNLYGQVGSGSPATPVLAPADVAGLTGATAIGAGDFFTCAVVAGGALKCWGYNYHGQFGDGTAAYHNTHVGALDGGAAVALSVSGCPSPTTAGVGCTLMVTASNATNGVAASYAGTVAFGSSDASAQLPLPYAFLPSDGGTHAFPVQLVTAGTHTVTATDQADTSIAGAQTNIVVVAGPPSAVAATGGTPQSTMVGTAFAQVLQATARDGYANAVAGAIVQFTLPNAGASATFAGGALIVNATTDAAGVAMSPVLTANGTAGSYAATANIAGVANGAAFLLANTLGAPASVTATGGTPQSATVATAFAAPLEATVRDTGGNALPGIDVVFALPASGASGTFAGGATTATVATNALGVATAPAFAANAVAGAFTATATVAGVGTPAQFALSNVAAPVPVAEVLSLAAGGHHNCVIESGSGAVRCWGDNGYGQLGDGTTASRSEPRPVVGLSGRALMVGTHLWHSCALMDTGGVKCWGFNANGRLGDGTTTDRSTPVDVVGLTSGVIAISVGGAHACALLQGGGLRCWGWNGNGGQVGDGTMVDRYAPVAVSGLASGVVAVSTGDSHTCALLADGAVKCWGLGSYGQLGHGTYSSSALPVDVAGLGGVVAIASGGLHTCALQANGQVQCWGDNPRGELGDGSTASRAIAAPVSGLANVAGVSGSEFHSCALTSGNGMACWGNNANGQIGTGDTAHRLAPYAHPQMTNLAAVRTGWLHTCALGNAGGVRCLGDNTYGQLGDDGPGGGATPVAVRKLDSSPITIEAAGGAGQSANTDAPFAQPLAALVRDGAGQPMAGIPVAFSIVGSGAAATFATGARIALAVSDAAGVATSPSFAANGDAGSYAATAVVVGRHAKAAFALTNGAPSAASIVAVSGSLQSTGVGTPFALPLQAQVRDAGGNPIAGAAVTFTLPASGASGAFAGGGTSAVANSDPAGIATSPVIVANVTLGPWTASATVLGVGPPATFNLSNVSGAPATIAAVGGTPQTTMTGTVFGAVLQARVADAYGNAVSGATVTFTLPATGASGNFPGPTRTAIAVTDAAGIAASPAITATSTAGTFSAVGAAAGVAASAAYVMTSVPRSGATVLATGGTPQATIAGTAFAQPLVATVRDGSGNPIPNLTLTFTIPGTTVSGTFAGGGKTATAVTDAAGTATSPLVTATTKTGTFIPYAVVSGLARANFSLAIGPDVPATVTARVGAQTAAVYTQFAKPLAVRVTDQYGNATPDIDVDFQIEHSAPQSAWFAPTKYAQTVLTDATGTATTVPLHANSFAGIYGASASVAGVATPATFKLTNTAGAGATVEVTGGTPQSATVATDFGQALQATVLDASARPVGGVDVTFTLPSSAASASFPGGVRTAKVATDHNGLAVSPTPTATNRAGAFSPSVKAAGVAGTKYYALTNLPAAPATATATVGAQTATIGTAFAKPLDVLVKDAFGNAVPNVPVTIALAPASPSAKFADGSATLDGVTDASGKLVSSPVTAEMFVGSHVATAQVGGLATAGLTFGLRNVISTGATIQATGGTPQTTAVNTPFPQRLTATVRDAGGNPVGGVLVTFTVPTTRGTFPGAVGSAQVATDASGMALSPPITASGVAAAWSATARASGVTGSVTYSMTNH